MSVFHHALVVGVASWRLEAAQSLQQIASLTSIDRLQGLMVADTFRACRERSSRFCMCSTMHG